MAEPKIKRAESGKSKGKTFTNLLGTYRKAIYKSHVEDGYELARYIDNQVKRIKSV